MQNTLQGSISRADEPEDQISNLEENKTENTQSKQQKRKKIIKKNQDSIKNLWSKLKCTNIHIIGIPEGEEREQVIENLFKKKTMMENFPNPVKEIYIQVQEAQSPKQNESK